MSEYLKRLANIEQDKDQRAAFYSEGSQVVIAGPGSGKTYLLTMKVAKILLEGKVRYPQKIACITFSRQLAEKLVKELRELSVYDSERIYVGTIHAFCIAEIIMPAVNLLPTGSIPEPFRIASENERRDALSQALQKQGKSFPSSDRNRKNLESDLDKFRRRYFQQATNNFSGKTHPEGSDYSRNALWDLDWSQLAGDYHDYLKQQAHGMDFVQVEMLALHILKTKPALARTLAARYPWWFVDEYQDLSPLFHQMVMYLVAQRLISVFAIGDPNQCIYEEVHGSRPESISELSDTVERICQNHRIVLLKNYRSCQNLWKNSSSLLNTGCRTKTRCARASPGATRWCIRVAGLPGRVISSRPRRLNRCDRMAQRKGVSCLFRRDIYRKSSTGRCSTRSANKTGSRRYLSRLLRNGEKAARLTAPTYWRRYCAQYRAGAGVSWSGLTFQSSQAVEGRSFISACTYSCFSWQCKQDA